MAYHQPLLSTLRHSLSIHPLSTSPDVIQRISEDFKQMLAPYLESQPLKNRTTPSPPLLHFPSPPDISCRLHALKLSNTSINALSDVFNARCTTWGTDVQSVFEELHTNLWMHTPPNMQDTLRPIIQKAKEVFIQYYTSVSSHYCEQLVRWIQEQCSNPNGCSHPFQNTKASAKPAFNSDFVPFLEDFFEHNAYPSMADRQLMARKSLMTARQIEVWFQNHRRRARKEGKPLRRLQPTDPLPPHLRLHSIENKMFDLLRTFRGKQDDDPSHFSSEQEPDIPAESDDDGFQIFPNTRSSILEDSDAPNPLNIPTPPPDSILRCARASVNPFEQKRSWCFEAPRWQRCSTTSKSHVKAYSSVDEITVLFSRLNIRDASYTRQLISRHSGFAATCSITTVCPPAPHPALVRTNVPPPSQISLIPAHPYCTPQREETASPSPGPPRAGEIAASRRLRKFARLPKRIPQSCPQTHQLVTLGGRHTSPCCSPTPRSRRSSSSSTSSSGSTSSTPRTPTQSSLPLPTSKYSPYPIIVDDSSRDLFVEWRRRTATADKDVGMKYPPAFDSSPSERIPSFPCLS
ncbi:hypothetical protein HGRIS_008215 [Hohenbuehelia grisea]|uniref:Homeobox domain-containing protein n=1 Tax=Hohenbuehelia grisea TaxID=104357 RepID=A0ABR3J7P3_9AGAR